MGHRRKERLFPPTFFRKWRGNFVFSCGLELLGNQFQQNLHFTEEGEYIVVNNSVVTSESGDLHVQTIQLLWVGQIAHVSLEVLCKWNCCDSLCYTFTFNHIYLWNVVVESARNTCTTAVSLYCMWIFLYFLIFVFCFFFWQLSNRPHFLVFVIW